MFPIQRPCHSSTHPTWCAGSIGSPNWALRLFPLGFRGGGGGGAGGGGF